MVIWNFLRFVANSLLGGPGLSSVPKGKGKTKASKTTSKKSSTDKDSASSDKETASVRTKAKTPAAKIVPPTPLTEPDQPKTQEFVIGARSNFKSATIDDAGICSRCTPQIPENHDSDLFIDLGIDFGTRYTKVCFRDSDSNQTTIVTFDQGDACLEQALIPSQLAILDRGEILTGLTSHEWENNKWPIVKIIDFIKMRLAYLDLPQEGSSWPPHIEELDGPETIENLSAYFLSRLIVRSRNWIQFSYPDLFKNRSATWVLKVGAPVEYWQGPAISRFERVLKLAWALSFSPSVLGADMLTLPHLRKCVNHVREWVDQHPNLDCSAKPEIAAAVWSHIRAAGSREGFFVLFDVGEGTTEGASFRFYREAGENKISFYSGLVKPLGVASLTHQMKDELEINDEIVKRHLLTWSVDSQNGSYSRLSQSETRHRLQRLVASVVVDGCHLYRQVRPYMWKDEIGSKLGIFMGGGGGRIPFYRDAIVATHTDFGHQQASIKPYDLHPVPIPKDLSMRTLEPGVFDRFAIAYGLSIPDGVFPEFDFPDEGDAPSSPSTRPSPPDYADTKDLC